MTVSLVATSRDQTTWLLEASTDYFRELGSDQDDLPRAEVVGWFDDPNTHVLTITQAGRRVGFALVDRFDSYHELCEFCILTEHRNKGIGSEAVPVCFAQFPGQWSLGVAKALPGTARFWDRVLQALPGVTELARGAPLTPYQSHSYTFAYKGTR